MRAFLRLHLTMLFVRFFFGRIFWAAPVPCAAVGLGFAL